jgi:SpoVK/Ycf46/Vps4 family AAA+-type ATPase
MSACSEADPKLPGLLRAAVVMMQRRVLVMLLQALDAMRTDNVPVFVVGVTAYPHRVHPSMAVAHRLGQPVALYSPSEQQRLALLTSMCARMALCQDPLCPLQCFPSSPVAPPAPPTSSYTLLHDVAGLTSGFLATDLLSLCREALMSAVTAFGDGEGNHDAVTTASGTATSPAEPPTAPVIHRRDFASALTTVSPSYQSSTVSVCTATHAHRVFTTQMTSRCWPPVYPL